MFSDGRCICKLVSGTFGEVAEPGWSRHGGQVVFSDPQQVFTLAAGVQAVLLQVSGSQEGAGIKVLTWELNNLLRLNPATVDELEALQVDNLKDGEPSKLTTS